LYFALSQNSQQSSQFSNGLTQMDTNSLTSTDSSTSTDSPTVIDPVIESLPGTSQMLNNADTLLASSEKAIRRKRRTHAEMLQDARNKLEEAKNNNKKMTKELLAEKKRIDKIEKILQDGPNKSKKSKKE
jgi:hypothetical protein